MPKSKKPRSAAVATAKSIHELEQAQRKLDKKKGDVETLKSAGALTAYMIGAVTAANLLLSNLVKPLSAYDLLQAAGIVAGTILLAIMAILFAVNAWTSLEVWASGRKKMQAMQLHHSCLASICADWLRGSCPSQDRDSGLIRNPKLLVLDAPCPGTVLWPT